MKLKFKLTLLLVMLVNICFYAQGTYTIKGVITAKADNSPIPGVSIRILKTTRGVETDFDGKYSLKVKKGDVLQFSYLGYSSQTVIIDSQKTLNISLIEDVSALDEIVVVGYGTVKKSDLVSSVAKADMSKAVATPTSDVNEMLRGRVSGLQVDVAGGTLRPGGTSEYFIFSRIPASATIASIQPIPEPKPYTTDSAKL